MPQRATVERLPRSVLRLARPRQWAKNILVFAAPGAAGVLDQAEQLGATAMAFVAITLAAIGTYCLNDAADADEDALHPTKRLRPVASGAISVRVARILGVAFILGGLAVTRVPGRWGLFVCVLAYVVVTTLYTQFLKHVAILDIVAVSAGFVIRAIAGAAAAGVEVSQWFLIVASFGSLFMVTGKRAAELASGEHAVRQRPVLSQYTSSYLEQLRTVTLGVTLLAYTLFAFEKADLVDAAVPWFDLSIVPFGLALLRYALLLDRGEGGAPEDVVLGDRGLQLAAVAWALVFMAGVYTR
jgi:decaprenyl-phosphate phosphoribosyltransferase